MHVVVTGAAGFIGQHVVASLRARGDHVTGIDRRPIAPGPTAILDELSSPSAVTVAALRSADAVIHLAGQPGVRDRDRRIEARRHRDNVLAGARVLSATPEDTPLVVVSSSSVYGGVDPGGPVRPSREDDPLRPRGGYARSKVQLERLCADRAARGGHIAVARPFTVAGERQRPDMAIARWIAALRAGRDVVILGAPDRRRDITDVRDVSRALVTMVDRRVTGTVNLGTGTTHRLDDIAATIADVLAVAPPRLVVHPADGAEVAVTCADTTRCSELLGFTPCTDLHVLVARQTAAATLLLEAV